MRKKLILAGIVLVLAIAAVWGGSVIYSNVQNDRASGELTLSPQTPRTGAPAGNDPAELSGTWTIAPGSQAGYRVDEVLNGQNTTVVGRTGEVTGQVTIEGTSLTAAKVEVVMNGLVTDSDSRDKQFQSFVKTSDFPTSTFTLTKPVDIGAVAGGATTVLTAGDLTIAGVTQPVTASLKAQTTPDGVEVQGSIPISFADFGVKAPNLVFVKVEDSGTIEMLLTLSK